MPSSMLTSRMLAPPRTCSSATSAAAVAVARLDQARELLRAGDVGALADHLEVGVGPDRQRSRGRRSATDCASGDGTAGTRPRRQACDRPGDRPDVIRRRAAAAADDVDEAAVGELAEQRRGLVRQLVVLAERVRQAGVRVAADVAVGDARQLRQVGPHVARRRARS